MQCHAAANYLPVVAANRIGAERGAAGELRFYGSSFIAGPISTARFSPPTANPELILRGSGKRPPRRMNLLGVQSFFFGKPRRKRVV